MKCNLLLKIGGEEGREGRGERILRGEKGGRNRVSFIQIQEYVGGGRGKGSAYSSHGLRQRGRGRGRGPRQKFLQGKGRNGVV